MKRSSKLFATAVMGFALTGFVLSCASTGSQTTSSGASEKTGFLHGYYERMTPGPKGGAKLRWIKPGVDFKKYNKIMMDSVIFYFAHDSEDKRLDGEAIKKITDECNLAIINELKAEYPFVAEPGPDVVRIRFAITDIKQSRPALSAVTTVIPVGLALSFVDRGATGSWTGSGATDAEFMALDSQTNEVLAVAQDEKSAGFTERYSKWGSSAEAFKFWADRIRDYLDRVHGRK